MVRPNDSKGFKASVALFEFLTNLFNILVGTFAILELLQIKKLYVLNEKISRFIEQQHEDFRGFSCLTDCVDWKS